MNHTQSPEVPRLRAWPPSTGDLPPGWRPLVQRFLSAPEGRGLTDFLRARIAAGATIYPATPLLALQLTPPEAVRAVVLGQDPYHGPRQAFGLAFAVQAGTRTPPSLRNIRAELAREYGREPMAEGLLRHWAGQGVLLLNDSLTVEDGQPASHARVGWQALTQAIFDHLVARGRPLVFLLWGRKAQARMPAEGARGPHLWLCSNHPSPLSARRPPIPFIGCDHFQRANRFLLAHDQPPVDWLGSAPEA